MKTIRKTPIIFFTTSCLIVLCTGLLGCGQEQQMLAPVMMAVVDEPATEESAMSAETPEYSPYDVNLDNKVDPTDLQLVVLAMDETSPENPRLDVNGNGVVDRMDLGLIYENMDTHMASITPSLEIPFDLTDVEIPPTRGVPAGVKVLETDKVFHLTTEGFAEEQQNWLGIFDTAEAATQAAPVVEFFDAVKVSLAGCASGDISFLPEVYLLFTSRAERQKFKQALPGGFITTVHEHPPATDERWNNWWEINAEPLIIVDLKDAYFGIGIYPNNPCQNFR